MFINVLPLRGRSLFWSQWFCWHFVFLDDSTRGPHTLCTCVQKQKSNLARNGRMEHEFYETCHSITFYFMKKDAKRCCDTTTPKSIHTKDESKRGSVFAFIFGVNWLWPCGVKASFGVFFHEIICNGMTSFMEFMQWLSCPISCPWWNLTPFPFLLLFFSPCMFFSLFHLFLVFICESYQLRAYALMMDAHLHLTKG